MRSWLSENTGYENCYEQILPTDVQLFLYPVSFIEEPLKDSDATLCLMICIKAIDSTHWKEKKKSIMKLIAMFLRGSGKCSKRLALLKVIQKCDFKAL